MNKPLPPSPQSQRAAEELFRWMSQDLKDHAGKDFLPANVCCDYAGMRYFINRMAEKIDQFKS